MRGVENIVPGSCTKKPRGLRGVVRYFAFRLASDWMMELAVVLSKMTVLATSGVMVASIWTVTLNPTEMDCPRTFVQTYAESMYMVSVPDLLVTFVADVCPP
jgi:hypothetical protein